MQHLAKSIRRGKPNASLKAKVVTFYSCIQEAISMNGQLMGMPINMNTQSWKLNQTLWDRFDLREVPQTYTALLTLLTEWQDTYAEENPDYTPVDLPGSIAECAKLLVREYILQCGSEYPDFTSEAFRTAMQALIANQSAIAANDENYGMPIIYSYYQGFGVGNNDSEQMRMMLMLAITAGEEQKLSGALTLLTMSSNCTKQDAALRFISCYYIFVLRTRQPAAGGDISLPKLYNGKAVVWRLSPRAKALVRKSVSRSSRCAAFDLCRLSAQRVTRVSEQIESAMGKDGKPL